VIYYKFYHLFVMYWYVYILKCNDGLFYCGITKNLKNRISEHNKGMCITTRKRRPVILVWSENFIFQKAARLMEEKIKSQGPRRFLYSKLNILKKIKNKNLSGIV